MSHYPSTAELAAFREDIHRLSGPHFTDDCTVGMSHPPEGGAWLDELSNGIGYLPWWAMSDARASRARREAGAMRTRAYEAASGDDRSLPGTDDRAWIDETQHGAPWAWGDPV